MRLNKSSRTVVDGEPAPDRNDEYRFYQALLGVWPDGETAATPDLVPRLQGYMTKAVQGSKAAFELDQSRTSSTRRR